MSNETVLSDAQCLAIGAFGQSPLKRLEHARAIEAAVLQSEQVQAWKRDAESMRGVLKKIAAMDSMSYHSLESAKIVAKAALENNP